MIYLQAVTNANGPAFGCFRLVDEGHVSLCVSEGILAEVREVLSRPKLQTKFRTLTPERVEVFLENVKAKAVVVDEVPKVISYPRDPDDEPYLNLAAAAGAAFLVSRDKDLLDLKEGADFRGDFPGLSILDPVAFLHEVRRRLASEGGETTSS
jgi:putative PIN family toxin of toxin-antitoxin system